jgi:hypothetical protein
LSKKRLKRSSDFKENGSFVPLYREMLKSSAWQGLSNTAKLAYINIKLNHFGNNANKIICPYTTITNKMSPTTWAKATNDLVRHGFIVMVEETRGLGRLPNIYALSNNWKHWGTEQFIEPEINTAVDPNKGFTRLWKEDPERMRQMRKKRLKK